MKLSLAPLLALSACSATLFADFEVQLVHASASADLPRSIPQEVKPMNSQTAATLSFLIKGENLVSLDSDSLKIENGGKWTAGFFNKVSEDGQYALLNITTNDEVFGKLDSLQLKGSVNALTGSKSESKTITLKDDAAPTELGDFTLKLKTEKGGKKAQFSMGTGIEVKGNLDSIKSIVVKIDDKEHKQNGYSGFNNTRTYFFKELKGDTVEVVFTYWTDLKEVSIPLEKS